jgi:multiple sugar transport system permease protein
MLWTNLGYYTVITLAGVRDIPREFYEAANLDGAGAIARFRWITIPLMRPILLFILMIATTDALTLFIQPYLLTQGGPGDATRTLSLLIYQVAFMYTDVGRASAIAVVLLVIALAISALQFYFFRHKQDI